MRVDPGVNPEHCLKTKQTKNPETVDKALFGEWLFLLHMCPVIRGTTVFELEGGLMTKGVVVQGV